MDDDNRKITEQLDSILYFFRPFLGELISVVWYGLEFDGFEVSNTIYKLRYIYTYINFILLTVPNLFGYLFLLI